MKFAHSTCGQVVAEYVGPGELTPGKVLRDADWLLAGDQPPTLSGMNFLCPYCNEVYRLGPVDLKQVKESVH